MVYNIKDIPGKNLLVVMEAIPDETTAGGLVMPGASDRAALLTAKVIAIGHGQDYDNPELSFTVEQRRQAGKLEGARILINRHAGTVLDRTDGFERRLVPMGAVIAVLE